MKVKNMGRGRGRKRKRGTGKRKGKGKEKRKELNWKIGSGSKKILVNHASVKEKLHK